MRDVLHFSLSPSSLAFLAWGDFHARLRVARSSIPEEKWGLLVVYGAATTFVIARRADLLQ